MGRDKENVVQAVVIIDTFCRNFWPICCNKSMAFLRVAGVQLIDYVLESLCNGGVDEVILFCTKEGGKIKEYIRKCVTDKVVWSLSMKTQVLMSDTCQSMGDVMREIDAAAIIKGHFILMGVNSIANISFCTLLEQHKANCKKDKGAAMTLLYKNLTGDHPLIKSDKTMFLAVDGNTNKILMHKKFKPKSHHKNIELALTSILDHSVVKLHHNLADVNIALCSPSVPPLFSDNFDFQTKEDFIKGILINEEILASSLYTYVLKDNQYAAAITNWRTYQIICRDLLHHWALPLCIETGSLYRNNFVCNGNHNYYHKTVTLSRSCKFIEDVLIGAKTHIGDETDINKSVIGYQVTIGKNVYIEGSHVMNNVIINDNCRIINSFIDNGCVVRENSIIDGSIIASNVNIKEGTELKNTVLECSEEIKKERSASESGTEWDNEVLSDDDEIIEFNKKWSDSDSNYSSESSTESSIPDSPVLDDTNIFLQEVIDSLMRGYEEKLKCDCLILEVNSSRYAYNIQLQEVNVGVVKAILSLPVLTKTKNILSTLKDVINFFQSILRNYIKTKSSRRDCLKAVEDSCLKHDYLQEKAGQVLHILYDSDIVDEDTLLEWYEDLKNSKSYLIQQKSLTSFFEWLKEASEESD